MRSGAVLTSVVTYAASKCTAESTAKKSQRGVGPFRLGPGCSRRGRPLFGKLSSVCTATLRHGQSLLSGLVCVTVCSLEVALPIPNALAHDAVTPLPGSPHAMMCRAPHL